MNKFLKSWQLIALSVFLSFVACREDDEPIQEVKGKKPILLETTVKNPDGVSGSSYMQLVEKLEGNIDNSNAIQVDFSTSIEVFGNDIFVFPAFGQTGNTEFKKYTYSKEGVLGMPQVMQIPSGVTIMNAVKVSEDKMYAPSFSIGKIIIFNPQTMQKTAEIDITKYAHKDSNPDASYGILREGLYYLPLNQIGADWMPHADHLQTDVLIIDTKTDKVIKMISEKQSGLCFPTRPMMKNMIFTDERNDIYITCIGYFGFNPMHLNNGFVCIPNGKQEFDTSKSWDISKTTIEGTSYKPASVMNAKYIGNGKLIAFATIRELTDNPYTAKNTMAVLIDLNAKTIKKIEGVPLTDAHSVVLEEHKGNIILGIYGKDKVGFFTYDPKTEKVTHNATTVGNPTYVHFFE